MKIQTRLCLGFGTLALLVLALGGYCVHYGQSDRAVFANVMRMAANRAKVNNLLRDMADARFSVWGAVATGESKRWEKAESLFMIF